MIGLFCEDIPSLSTLGQILSLIQSTITWIFQTEHSLTLQFLKRDPAPQTRPAQVPSVLHREPKPAYAC